MGRSNKNKNKQGVAADQQTAGKEVAPAPQSQARTPGIVIDTEREDDLAKSRWAPSPSPPPPPPPPPPPSPPPSGGPELVSGSAQMPTVLPETSAAASAPAEAAKTRDEARQERNKERMRQRNRKVKEEKLQSSPIFSCGGCGAATAIECKNCGTRLNKDDGCKHCNQRSFVAGPKRKDPQGETGDVEDVNNNDDDKKGPTALLAELEGTLSTLRKDLKETREAAMAEKDAAADAAEKADVEKKSLFNDSEMKDEKIADLESLNDQLVDKDKRAVAKLEAALDDLYKARKINDRVAVERNKAEDRNITLQREVETLKNQLEISHKVAEAEKLNFAKLDKKLGTSIDKEINLRAFIDDLEKRLTKQQDEYAEVTEQKIRVSQQLREKDATLRVTERNLSTVQEVNKSFERIRKHHENENARLREDVTRQRELITAKDLEIQGLTQDNAGLLTSKTNLMMQLTTMNEQLKEFQEVVLERDELIEDQRRYEMEISIVNAAVEELTVDRARLEDAIVALHSRRQGKEKPFTRQNTASTNQTASTATTDTSQEGSKSKATGSNLEDELRFGPESSNRFYVSSDDDYSDNDVKRKQRAAGLDDVAEEPSASPEDMSPSEETLDEYHGHDDLSSPVTIIEYTERKSEVAGPHLADRRGDGKSIGVSDTRHVEYDAATQERIAAETALAAATSTAHAQAFSQAAEQSETSRPRQPASVGPLHSPQQGQQQLTPPLSSSLSGTHSSSSSSSSDAMGAQLATAAATSLPVSSRSHSVSVRPISSSTAVSPPGNNDVASSAPAQTPSSSEQQQQQQQPTTSFSAANDGKLEETSNVPDSKTPSLPSPATSSSAASTITPTKYQAVILRTRTRATRGRWSLQSLFSKLSAAAAAAAPAATTTTITTPTTTPSGSIVPHHNALACWLSADLAALRLLFLLALQLWALLDGLLSSSSPSSFFVLIAPVVALLSRPIPAIVKPFERQQQQQQQRRLSPQSASPAASSAPASSRSPLAFWSSSSSSSSSSSQSRPGQGPDTPGAPATAAVLLVFAAHLAVYLLVWLAWGAMAEAAAEQARWMRANEVTRRMVLDLRGVGFGGAGPSSSASSSLAFTGGGGGNGASLGMRRYNYDGPQMTGWRWLDDLVFEWDVQAGLPLGRAG